MAIKGNIRILKKWEKQKPNTFSSPKARAKRGKRGEERKEEEEKEEEGGGEEEDQGMCLGIKCILNS